MNALVNDELRVGEFTITDSDGNVRHGSHGALFGEGVGMLITAARAISVLCGTEGAALAAQVVESEEQET